MLRIFFEPPDESALQKMHRGAGCFGDVFGRPHHPFFAEEALIDLGQGIDQSVEGGAAFTFDH